MEIDFQQSCLGNSMENGFPFQNVTGIILISLWEKTDLKSNAKKKKKIPKCKNQNSKGFWFKMVEQKDIHSSLLVRASKQ